MRPRSAEPAGRHRRCEQPSSSHLRTAGVATAVVSTLGFALVNTTGIGHSASRTVAFPPLPAVVGPQAAAGPSEAVPVEHTPVEQGGVEDHGRDDRAARAGKETAQAKHDEALAQLARLLETRRAAAERASRARRLASLKWARPNVGPLTQHFGGPGGHPGIDLGGPYGSPIVAAYRGTVVYAGWESGYGNFVMIQHPDGNVTAYGHMSAILVTVGQQVQTGQQIGREGSTGFSTGPHLHFEVRLGGPNGEKTDPLGWLAVHGVVI